MSASPNSPFISHLDYELKNNVTYLLLVNSDKSEFCSNSGISTYHSAE